MTVCAYAGLVISAAVALLSWTIPPREQGATVNPGAAASVAAEVDGQPLAANIQRLVEALEYLGSPLPADLRADLGRAGKARDAKLLQQRLDSRVLLAVHINP